VKSNLSQATFLSRQQSNKFFGELAVSWILAFGEKIQKITHVNELNPGFYCCTVG